MPIGAIEGVGKTLIALSETVNDGSQTSKLR